MTPIVSVCVPTYNYGRFLSDCIASVLRQSLGLWELVVCDDCSDDETDRIMSRYASRDSRVRYIRNERRLGMSGNLRRVAELATGRYLKILCSDDWMEPRCLEVMVRLLDAHPNVVLGTCAEIHTDASGRPERIQFLYGQPLTVVAGQTMLDRMAWGDGFGGNSSFFIRASAYHGCGGYDETRPYAVDYDLAARLCGVGNYLHTDEPLFYGRSHAASSTSVNPKRLLDVQDWFAVARKVFPADAFGSREWRRNNLLVGRLTARYLVNTVVEYARGHRDYANALCEILLRQGNFLWGLPLLSLHAPWRLYAKLTGALEPLSLPPSPGMGPPIVGASVEHG